MRKFSKVLIFSLFAVVAVAFLASLAGTSTGATFVDENGVVTVNVSKNGTGVKVLDQDKNGMTIRMDIGDIKFIPVSTKEGQFILPRIDGFTQSFKVGEPMLPMAAKLLSVPFDCALKADIVDFSTANIDLASKGLNDPIMPVQAPLSKSDNPLTAKFEYNKSVYETPGKYALTPTDAKVLGTLRSIHLGRVAIAPVEYYPTEKRLTVYKSVTVRIKFKNPNWAKTKKIGNKHHSDAFDVVESQVLNATEAIDYRDDLVKYPVKYLIIADRMFEAQLAPFVQWKTKKGFNVITAYTDVIGTSTTAIKAYIQGLYNAGTSEDPAPSFVLFVGDDQQIPAWSGDAGNHITDLDYCEFTGDDFPEIYYGRFSAQTTALLQPQIDKTLEYEQYTMPDPSYLGDVTLVSGVDSSYAPTHGNGQINYGTNYYFNAAHGISPNVWLYPASDASGAAADIIQTISDGVGFYNYTAHCSHTGPADPPFNQANVYSLTNTHKYLLGIGNCCLSNTFGDNYSDACFGEAWLQAPDKGGIGWIGTTNNSYWNEDYWWGVGNGPIIGTGATYEETGIGAYDGVFHDHSEPVERHYVTNSGIIFCGNMAVTEAGSSLTDYYWEIYTLMGDPSVMTYMGMPSANTVNHPSSIIIGETSVTVQAAAGSYVGITFNGNFHGAGYIGATGSAVIPITAFTEMGNATIVVTCQNYIPYEANIPVDNGTSPPTTDFIGTPTSGAVPLTVVFTDQSTGATSWLWNFGDSATSTEKNPTHIYTSTGTYTVSLTATNANGSDVMTKTDYIVVVQNPPVADFSYSANLLQVTFTDLSTDADGTIASWLWDFGDGNTSTAQNPVHTYAAKGTYSVSLTAYDNEGASDNKTINITVDDGLTPEIYVDNINVSVARSGGSKYVATAVITIKDTDNSAVSGATVYATWSGSYSGTVSGVTAADGTVSFSAPRLKASGPYTITVTNVTHSVMDYNSSLNNETSDSGSY